MMITYLLLLAVAVGGPPPADTTEPDTSIVYKAEARSQSDKTRLTFAPGEPVIVRADLSIPETKHFIRWKVSGGVSYETFEQDTVLILGALPGEYDAEFLFVDFEKALIVEEEFIVAVQGARPPPDEPDVPVVDTTVTKAVVVHESSEHPILPHTMSARDKVEGLGVEYRIVDQDVKTGDGQTPKDVAPAIEAAKAADVPFPVLVLIAGKSIKVVPLPKTAELIVKEVQGGN